MDSLEGPEASRLERGALKFGRAACKGCIGLGFGGIVIGGATELHDTASSVGFEVMKNGVEGIVVGAVALKFFDFMEWAGNKIRSMDNRGEV